MARRASYSEGAAFAALSFVSIVAAGLVSTVLVARAYGVEVIGEYAIALAPAATLGTLSQLREQAGLVRELATLPPRAARVTGLFAAVMTFSFGLTVVVAAPVTVGSWFVLSGPVDRADLFAPAAVLIASYMLLDNTYWNLDVVFSAFRAGRQLFWTRLLQALAYLALALSLSDAFRRPIWGLVVATGASAAIVVVHRLVLVRGFMRLSVPRAELRAGFRTLPDLVRFGAKIAPGAIADGVARQSTVWVLSLTVPVAAVGAYSRAWTVVTRFVELNFRLPEMLFPTLVERRAGGDAEGFDRAAVDSMRYWVAAMALPAAAGGGAAAGVMQLFGPRFESAADALALLLLVPALAAVASIQTAVLWTDGRPWLSTLITSVRAVITVGLTAAFAVEWGITGAAAAMALAYAVDVAWSVTVMRRHWSSPLRALWPYRGRFAVAVAYAVGFVAARGVDRSLGGIGGTACALAAGTLAYVAVVVAAGGLVRRDRERLALLLSRLRARAPARRS